ncbi:MAG: LPXTG cell wall anchor domain-containing protein [Acidimicrobiales bacterium]
MIKRTLLAAAIGVLVLAGPALSGTANAQTGPSGLPSPGGGIAITCTVTGTSISCTVTGLQPGSTFTLILTSTPQQVASGTATATGTASATFAIPCGLESGAHTVTVNGTDAAGVAGSASTAINIDPAVIATVAAGCATGARTGTTGPLARTGASNTAQYVGFGLAAIAGGGVLLVASRKRRTPSAS